MLFEGVFLYFCPLDNSKIKHDMDVFLILSSIFILAYIAVRQILKNVSGLIPPEESAKYLPFV